MDQFLNRSRSIIFLLFLIPVGVLAQPSNNTCETATDISSNIGGNVCGDDGSATNDGDDGDVTSCYDSDSEVWYSFSGVSSIEVQITSWCGSTYEPNITIYEGSCGGGLSEIACDDFGGSAEVVQAGSLDSTQTYYISVDNDEADCEGSFCFDISEASPGDCMGSAEEISECGTTFTLDNSSMGQCGQQCCGNTRNSNYDGDCGSSTCSTCGDGCDMNGSTENNAFWTFTPTETCDYEVTMDIYDCDNEGSCYSCSHGLDTCCGVQYGIYEYDGTSFTNYYAQDGTASGSPITITETFTATSGTPVVIMVDGYAGDACSVDISVSPQNCSGCTVLPIELLSFEGKAKAEGNKLTWLTGSETKNSHFIVQRSKEGNEFNDLQKVEGAGTTNSRNRYQVMDDSPYPLTYYRLKQVDMNGKAIYSNVIAIHNRDRGYFLNRVFPNPTNTNRVNLQIESSSSREIKIEIYNQQGERVGLLDRSLSKGANRLKVNISELPVGFYSLRIMERGNSNKSVIDHFTKIQGPNR